jgi:hypothetical protein
MYVITETDAVHHGVAWGARYMKLIVMLISLSVHYGPATISGFDTLAGCRAAEPVVVAFYKKTTSSAAKTECVEFPK